MNDQQTDEKVIERILGGEIDAFELLVDRYKNLVFSLSLRMTRNPSEAEDLAQETFLRAYRFLSSYKTDFKFSTWISRIALNLFRDRFKKATLPTAEAEELDRHPDEKNNPETESMRNLKRRDIVSIIGRLDEKFREIVVLYFFEEFSYEEIGKALDVPIGTVKSRLNRAKAILLEQHGRDLEKWCG